MPPVILGQIKAKSVPETATTWVCHGDSNYTIWQDFPCSSDFHVDGKKSLYSNSRRASVTTLSPLCLLQGGLRPWAL